MIVFLLVCNRAVEHGSGFLANPRTSTNHAGAMTLVQLPRAKLELSTSGAARTIDARLSTMLTSTHAKHVQDWLYAKGIEVCFDNDWLLALICSAITLVCCI